ncbi:kinesin-like protein KIFC1 [Amphibalanus amphitrite]|uniref:kinesin-like protein KIFC1 n=1 Tax=Amphibalanus amphitrite TaxID=1232801 RepID=UPI001C90A637|nr:kinesin-like protein KIFC1 [Amphibalanus amphitrite]
MSRLPTPSSRLPVAGTSRLTAASGIVRPTPRATPATAGSASALKRQASQSSMATKRGRLDTSGSSDGSSTGRPPRAGSMRPPANPGLIRSKSVANLSTPAGRPMRDVTSRVVSRNNVKAAGTVGGRPGAAKPTPKPAAKRQPWDLKGQIQDMDARHRELMEQLQLTQERVSRMEEEKQQLEQGVREKETITAEVQSEAQRVSRQLQDREDQWESERRQLQRRLSELEAQREDSETQRAALQRRLTSLQAELQAKTDEADALRSSVAQLTAAQATVGAQLSAAQLTVQQLTAARDQLEATLRERDATVAELEARARREETLRRQLHNQVQELKGNIRVFCRVRPLLGEEVVQADGQIPHLQVTDERSLEIGKAAGAGANETMSGRRREEGDGKVNFAFDRVFPPQTSQADVFEEISQLIQSALDGYNVCVFAYGQTGSGKTHTMEGGRDDELQGVIPRAVSQIFDACAALKEKGWSYTLEASFLEIYNETIRDLLSTSKEKMNYEIRMKDSKLNSKTKEVYVTNLKVVTVTEQADVASLLERARQQRAVAATNCNEHSSRSHSVFTLRMEGRNALTTETCHGSLNLVDLAGSERLKESGSQGDRLTETKNINKSLANLGNVIMALGNKQDHVPFRNSKLTHLLQHSLGGNSKTLMFVNVSPREDCAAETLNSLRFAAKVNQCHIGTATKRTK